MNLLHNFALHCLLIIKINQTIRIRCFIHYVEINLFLVSRYWNSNSTNFFKSISKRTEKKIKSFAYTMQNSTDLGKPLPLLSFALHRNLKPVQFSDKLEPLRNDPFKIFNQTMEVNFTRIEIVYFQVFVKNLCSYLTLSHTMNQIVCFWTKYIMLLIQQTWSKLTHILQIKNLNWW